MLRMSFLAPEIDDIEILNCLPLDLSTLLQETNGFIKYDGGLHLRGAVLAPEWHSIRAIWRGQSSPLRRYDGVHPDDVPFGQDALGDQFLLRDDEVWRLYGETGELEALGVDLLDFLERARQNPMQYLQLQPLQAFIREGGRLGPGQLLSAYPPFCTAESKAGVSYRAVPTLERLGFLADFSEQIRDLQEGGQIKLEIE